MIPPLRLVPGPVAFSAFLALTAVWAGSPFPAAGVQNGNGGAPDSEVTLEVARAEMEAGRNWHAAEVLTEMRRVAELPPGGLFLLAQARAGFRDWDGVGEILLDGGWLASVAPVEGPYLLGRSFEAVGNWEEAAAQYRTALDRVTEVSFPLGARLARAELRSGRPDAALAVLSSLETGDADPLLSSLAWELAQWVTAEGDSATVGRLLPLVRNRGLRERAADYYPRAVLAEGDSARAESLYRALLAGETGPETPGWKERVAALTLARGDTAAARELFRETLLEAGRSAAGMESARRLVLLGGLDRDLALRAARALDRLGDGARALSAYDTYVRLSLQEGIEADALARVERARLAATVPSRTAEAVEEYRALDEHPDPAVGARVLELWAGLRRRQGQADNVRTLGRWLVERYPDTDQAAEVVFLRGDAAHDRGDWDAALGHYRDVVAMAPSRTLAGVARMRMGQIQLHTGDPDGALVTFRGYVEDFPRGRRWAEASFWSGRILLETGDTAGAVPFLDRVMAEDPFSYYAVEAARLLGVPFPVIAGEEPAVEDAAWVGPALERLDLLDEADLARAADIHVQTLVARAGAEGREAGYPLAEGLIHRGRTIEGINLGWALVRADEPWNPRLLRILYPFPNREMVEREAAEWGVDPLLMAGLIRQESAWDRDIVSSAGAIGLMQVMPPTGRQLAQAVGPAGYTPQALETAEVNLHLGGRFLRDMLDRFGPELPLVLSAYNAGPTRARRWSDFPEAADRLRFTERIPFDETRGYVKNVTRNLALYRALYGSPAGPPVTE